MPGVQIHHADVRDATFVFEIPDWPYPVPFLCSTCNTTHLHKAVHLRFDSMGDCVVAEETWDRIAPYLAGEVSVGKKVSDPEPLVLGMNGSSETYQVVRMED